MGSLELQLEKQNLEIAVDLGVVASVRQIKNEIGEFPEEPFEQELVIPVSAQTSKREIDVPVGTYRIEARLPSGEVLRETRKVGDDNDRVEVVFRSHRSSPHEWLSLQRLAGNVPSQQFYETWLKDLALKIGDQAAKKQLLPDGSIELDPAYVSKMAAFLRGLHLRVKPAIDYVAEVAAKVSDRTSDSGSVKTDVASQDKSAEPRQNLPDFRIVECDAANGESLWDALASVSGWTNWEKAARPNSNCTWEERDDGAITLWKNFRNLGGSIDGQSPARCFAVSRRGDCVDVISLPAPWSLINDAPPALEILREAGVSFSGRTTVTVGDPVVGGLLLYLNNGKIVEASTVLAAAAKDGTVERLISEKQRNPLAACAAAYIGLATFSGGDAPRWGPWLANINNWFTWLPDGAVVQAVYLMKTAKSKNDLDAAAAAFASAYRRGVPFYATGVQQLLQGLYLFRRESAEIEAMYRKVSSAALRVDPDQTFTVVTVHS